VDSFTVNAGGGADAVSAAGGSGTGGSFSLPVTFNGSFGHDRLTGGTAADTINGCPMTT
jgi:hypothetical protein